MKAVLMVAGPTSGKTWPPDPKPRCLFHYDGEVILEMQARVLREAGINDITVVAGYKIEMVQKFNKDKQLGLNVLYNPSAASDKLGGRGWIKGLETAKIGVRSADDDVLLIFGDVIIRVDAIKKVVEDENQCISVYSGSGYHLYKIPKALIPALINYSGRGGGMMDLHNFCIDNDGIRMVLGWGTVKNGWMKTCKTKIVQLSAVHDIDYFYQTDEGKKKGVTAKSHKIEQDKQILKNAEEREKKFFIRHMRAYMKMEKMLSQMKEGKRACCKGF